jgi:hypothetical protein
MSVHGRLAVQFSRLTRQLPGVDFPRRRANPYFLSVSGRRHLVLSYAFDTNDMHFSITPSGFAARTSPTSSSMLSAGWRARARVRRK